MVRLIMILSFLLVLSPVYGSPALMELNTRVVYIGGDENFPPYEYVVESDEAQVYRGFNVDIMKAIALETGMEIQFRPMKWSQALQALEQGELDVIQGMKYDINRLGQYDFSQEYLISSQAIFVRNDSYISGLDDIKGQQIAVQEGDIAHQQLKNNPDYILVPVPYQTDAFELLLQGEVAAVVGNKLAGHYILQRTDNVRKVKTVGDEINPERYGAAVRKGNTQLLETLNRGLVDIKRNGTYEKIYVKWFGEQLDYPTAYYKDRLFIALSILGALGLVVVLLSYISYILRQKVAKRTEEIGNINRMLIEKNEYIRKESLYKENILNSSYNGIVTINQNGVIGFANSYAKECFPYTPLVGEQFRRTPLTAFLTDDLFAAAFQEQHVPSVERMINNRYWAIMVRVFRQEEEVDSILLSFRDITPEKQMREQLSRKDKMESLGNLVAGIAHEIRTPLTSIKTFAELLPAKYDHSAFRATFSQYVPQEVDRLNTIVNDLLDYARPRQPFCTLIPVRQLFQGILPLFRGRFETQHMAMMIDIPETTEVYADKQQLQQVLINILLNAVEAQQDAGEPFIRIYTIEDRETVTVVIEDNGSGIDAAGQNMIFDPFYTTKSHGTGLGLAISYQLMKENRGEIWAENVSGGGAKLYLRLPKRSAKGEQNDQDISC